MAEGKAENIRKGSADHTAGQTDKTGLVAFADLGKAARGQLRIRNQMGNTAKEQNKGNNAEGAPADKLIPAGKLKPDQIDQSGNGYVIDIAPEQAADQINEELEDQSVIGEQNADENKQQQTAEGGKGIPQGEGRIAAKHRAGILLLLFLLSGGIQRVFRTPAALGGRFLHRHSLALFRLSSLLRLGQFVVSQRKTPPLNQ